MKVAIEVDLDDLGLLEALIALARFCEIYDRHIDNKDNFANLNENASLSRALHKIIVALDYWRDIHTESDEFFDYMFYGEMDAEYVRSEWIESLRCIDECCDGLLKKMK